MEVEYSDLRETDMIYYLLLTVHELLRFYGLVVSKG